MSRRQRDGLWSISPLFLVVWPCQAAADSVSMIDCRKPDSPRVSTHAASAAMRWAFALVFLVAGCADPPPEPPTVWERYLRETYPAGLQKPLHGRVMPEYLPCEQIGALDGPGPICVHVEDYELPWETGPLCSNIDIIPVGSAHLPVIRATQKRVSRMAGRAGWNVVNVDHPIVLASYDVCLSAPVELEVDDDGVQHMQAYVKLDHPASAEVRSTRFTYQLPGEDEIHHGRLGPPEGRAGTEAVE